jgi:hypothetical protein
MEKPFKYNRKIIITLESNNFGKMQELAYKYYSVRPTKEENNPDDKNNFVSIGSSQEDL